MRIIVLSSAGNGDQQLRKAEAKVLSVHRGGGSDSLCGALQRAAAASSLRPSSVHGEWKPNSQKCFPNDRSSDSAVLAASQPGITSL